MQFDVSRKLEKIDNFIFGQTYLKFADYISTSKILFNYLYTIDKIKCLQRIEEQLLKVSASYGKSSSQYFERNILGSNIQPSSHLNVLET